MVFLNWNAPAVVLVRLRPLLVRGADGGGGAGRCSRFVFGWLAFRSRVTGVYLSIITQALTYALMLAFFRNDMGFGGNNGFTDFKDILGFNLQADTHARRRCSRRPRWRWRSAYLLACAHRDVAARPRAGRHPRRREPHALPRLPGRDTTSCWSSRCRRCSPASPARSTCRRSASSTRASSRRSTRSRSSSGWPSAAAARLPARSLGARAGQLREDLTSPARCPRLWLFALGGLFVAGDAVPAEGHPRPAGPGAGRLGAAAGANRSSTPRAPRRRDAP